MKIEMSGLLTSGQVLGLTSSKEFTVHVPKFEIPKFPIRKQILIEKIEGEAGINIITPDAQKLYKEMKERQKRELEALRQGW